MSFCKKKQKKCGQGCPRKVPPPPLQPAKKQKVDEPKAGHRNKYHNYSNPAVAAARLEAVEFYISTGGKFPIQPIINTPKRVIKRDAEKLSQNNKQTNNKTPPFWLNSGGNAMVMGSRNKNTTSKSLMSESTRAFIAQLQSAVMKYR